MDFCPNCGSMILNGTICDICHTDIEAFRFEKLEIGIPDNYISNKSLKYDELLDLIINKNQIEFTKNDILQYSNEIINKANDNFIKHNKKSVLNELNKYLTSYDKFVDGDERLNIKSMFKYDYFDYYADLNMDKIIDGFNLKIINRQKQDILDNLPNKYISHSEMQEYQKENRVLFDLDDIIEEHNNNFIENNIYADNYFDNVAGVNLDKNQRIAVLIDDDNTQIVAGAGTGKTLTIQAKVKYLIEKQGISPEDILCISFSNSARDDLERKLRLTIGDAPVDVRTFHSLGYSILGFNGFDREVPDHELSGFIDKYFKQSFVENPDLLRDVVEFFAYYFDIIYLNEDDLKLETFKSRLTALNEYDEYLSEYLQVDNLKRTKEYVNHISNLTVANFLFMHNINYECSKQTVFKSKNYDKYISNYFEYLFGDENNNIPYDIKLECINEFHDGFACSKSEKYSAFFLPDEDIYIDLTFVKHDWEDILDDNKKQKISERLKKRDKLNNSFKTKLITLFDWKDDIEGLLNQLQVNLNEFNVLINDSNYELIFEKIISQNNPEYMRFIKTIESFINLFKGNGSNIDYDGNDISKLKFDEFLVKNHELYSNSFEKRNKFYLNIVENTYHAYCEFLISNNYIDFNDMGTVKLNAPFFGFLSKHLFCA